jgi:hypothetical protein
MRGIPVSIIVVVVGLAGCGGTCSVTCGNASYSIGSDNEDKGGSEASMSGVARVTSSTHAQIRPDMRCKVTVVKAPSDTKAKALVSCFATAADTATPMYDGTSSTFTLEERATRENMRILYIDETKDVRTRIEYDGTKEPAGSFVVWSTNPAWEIKGEAPARAKDAP